MPAPASGVADSLALTQKCFAAPELLFRPHALGNFLFQLLVGSQKLASSLRVPFIDFLCASLLLAQEPRLLQSDRRLVRRYIKQKPLSLRRKIRSRGTCDELTQFSLDAQSQKHDRNVSISHRIRHEQTRSMWKIAQPGVERTADHLRRIRQISVLPGPDHLQGRPPGRILQPGVGEIQVQHRRQHVEQSADNLGRLSATPNSGKRLDADQVVNTSLEALNLIGCVFHLSFHGQATSGRYFRPERAAFAQFPQKLIRRYKEGVLLDDAADENHRVSSHDVDDKVAATLRQIIKTDYGIFILRYDVVQPALVFEEIVYPGPVA